MFVKDRSTLRQAYYIAWVKHQNKDILSPLEAELVSVIAEHPEYQGMLKHDVYIEKDYPMNGKENPFFHMGLHMAIREQCKTNRPVGISSLYQHSVSTGHSPHEVEHVMMKCLATWLIQAGQTGDDLDEEAYLKDIHHALRLEMA
jgi:Domain of unknown function (DUF1841)